MSKRRERRELKRIEEIAERETTFLTRYEGTTDVFSVETKGHKYLVVVPALTEIENRKLKVGLFIDRMVIGCVDEEGRAVSPYPFTKFSWADTPEFPMP